jgi:hypothetical protein
MYKPKKSGLRNIILEPEYCSSDLDIDVYVNGKKQLDFKEDKILDHSCFSSFNGYVEVKIVVNSGSITLSNKSGKGIYSCVFSPNEPDVVEGNVVALQHNHVNWMQFIKINGEENEFDIMSNNLIVESGNTLEYVHLIPNGPEWIKCYFNSQKTIDYFKKSKLLYGANVNENLFEIVINDYNPIDISSDPFSRTKNLMTKYVEDKNV